MKAGQIKLVKKKQKKKQKKREKRVGKKQGGIKLLKIISNTLS